MLPGAEHDGLLPDGQPCAMLSEWHVIASGTYIVESKGDVDVVSNGD